MVETFFNLEIIQAAWPIILAGLGNTVLLSLVVVPLGLLGGLGLAMLASVRNCCAKRINHFGLLALRVLVFTTPFDERGLLCLYHFSVQ